MVSSRCRSLIAVLTLIAAALSPALAHEVVVEGRALVRGGDVAQAREQAVRRALARAGEVRGAMVSSSSIVLPGAVFETAQVSATACTTDAEVIGERRENDEITVNVRVRVLDGAACQSGCQSPYVKKLVVAGFPLEFPGQMASGEANLPYFTAVELTRKLVAHGRVLAEYDASVFPYATPARAPEPHLRATGGETPFAALARGRRGQYVLAGVYRDLGVRPGGLFGRNSRQIEIEAFLHDGANGVLLARRKFSRLVHGATRFGNEPKVGSRTFYNDEPGRAWGALIDDVASWAERTSICLPFLARVLKTENDLIYLDAGAEARLSVEDTLYLHGWLEPPVRDATDQLIGQEKKLRGVVRLKAVYPGFSIAELAEGNPSAAVVRPGDVLYAQ